MDVTHLLAQVPNVAPDVSGLPISRQLLQGLGWTLGGGLILCAIAFGGYAVALAWGRMSGRVSSAASGRSGIGMALVAAALIAAAIPLVNWAADIGRGIGG